MPLSPEDKQFLREVYANTDPNKPLVPDSPFYQPIYEGPGIEDPIARLQEKIELAQPEGVFLLSGFRGSGKTTELFRLKKRLEQGGDIVLYANALNYLHPAQPVDIAHLLMAVAGALGEAVEGLGFGDPIQEGYWTRLGNFLVDTNVEFKELTAGGLKLALRDSDSFRQRVSQVMSGHVSRLENEVKQFAESCVKRIRKKRPGSARIVFLFDQLEQIRGSLSGAGEVIASVERLFAQHFDRLGMPYIHIVYTVPPWLKFVLQGLPVHVLHSVRQWDNDAGRTPYAVGNRGLLEAVVRRFGPEGVTRFWGDAGNAMRLVEMCGGHFKDLLRMVQETIARAGASGRLPVSAEMVRMSILDAKTWFLPIAMDDGLWLRDVGETRRCPLPSSSADHVHRLSRLIDTHLILYLRNGEEWYDVHPLVQSEVLAIAAAAARQRDQPR